MNSQQKVYVPEKAWKSSNARYISEMQKFIDITSNVQDEKLKMEIIYQMNKCEKIITEIAEEFMKENQRKKN